MGAQLPYEIMKHLRFNTERYVPVSWQGILEDSRRLGGVFIKASSVVTGRLQKEWCLASSHVAKKIVHLNKHSKTKFTVQYLGKSSYLLPDHLCESGPAKYEGTRVRMTKSQIPVILAPYHRKLLRSSKGEATRD